MYANVCWSDLSVMIRSSFCWTNALLLVATCFSIVSVAASEPSEKEAGSRTVSFLNDIQPIFRQQCYGCHQDAKQQGEYRMTDFAAMLAGGESGEVAIVPGKPTESYLIDQITANDGFAEMPKSLPHARTPAKPLNKIEVELIAKWIAQGAKDDSPVETGPRYDQENVPTYIGPPPLPSIDAHTDDESGTTRVAVAGFHEILLFDLAERKLAQRFVGMSPRINSVRFSPDGKFLAAVGGEPAVSGEVQVWDVEKSELVLSKTLTYDALCGLSWSPDGSKIAFGASDNVVRALDAKTGEQVLFQGAHDDWVRDTIFTPDGTHLISVARDMSCKLTEVETERFVDNITSITPGALSGGLNSVTRHPERNEIFIGGADGIAKVYRVFRETARKIGDDANLIKTFPEMPGRIFSVAVSPDGSRLAAAATLDGQSEVRIWEYNFDGTLTDEIKKIQGKRAADRSAAEKKKLANYRGGKTNELAKFAVSNAAVYALCFAGDNSVIFAADDGLIRHLDADGKLASDFPAVPIDSSQTPSALAFDAKSFDKYVSTQNEDRPREPGSNGKSPDDWQAALRIEVHPDSVELDSPYDYVQLVVTAEMSDGSSVDVTRVCEIQSPKWTTITDRGLVRAATDGKGVFTVRLGDQTKRVDVVATNVSTKEGHGAVDFVRDVNPVLSRLGCNQGTCHGAQKGKNGFKLSLRGYDPVYDLRALTDDLAARRINAADPQQSLMLRKPLGLTPHEGGAVMTAGDPSHTILRRWITDGCNLDLKTTKVSKIEVYPVNPTVQKTDATQQVRVIATYPDGSKRDVTQESFIESGNTEVATADEQGLLSAVRRGEAPILARYEGAYAATTMTVMGNRDGYKDDQYESWDRIDSLVAEKWKRVKVVPSKLCDDTTFLRRVHLDLTGLPPSSDAVRKFSNDKRPTRVKRSEVIDQLIGSNDYVEFWTNKWADLLQVNRKFLGVEGSVKFRDWIRQAIVDNRPYDEFARQVLTATGSNKENPAASYFKVLRTPEETMENTTHLFMGVRFNCNKCHDHPFERWTQDQYYEMTAFFAQVDLKADPASGNKKIGGTAVEGAKPLYEMVLDKKDGETLHARTGKVVAPDFPVDVPHECSGEATRREKLAAWMTDPENPFFARSYVNRIWGYLLGVGLIEPIDDIRAGNPATNPELLDYLTNQFIDSEFNVQNLLRLICNSRTYQLSVETNPLNEDDSLNYARALPRRLPAEVIYDSVHTLTGAISEIPGMPKGSRAASVTDSGIKLADGFLQNLGRPARESACECERSDGLQLGPVMALISGPTIGTAIADPKNELEKIVQTCSTDEELAEEIFLRALGRFPNESEVSSFKSMTEMIKTDHVAIVEKLGLAEKNWEEKHKELEATRKQRLAETSKQVKARAEAIKPERARLAAERDKRIADSQKALAETEGKINQKVQAWEKRQSNAVEWFPLAATGASSTNKAKLTPQPDRSIIASGNAMPGIYTIQATTSLKNITGFRLEALADPNLPSNGPGLPPNGNFVVSEFEVNAKPIGVKDAEDVSLIISSAKADFTQRGFNVVKAYDGQPRGQEGWAVSGATGVVHWATFKLNKPLKAETKTMLTFKIHQFHKATDHRLGRFRISVTTADGDIPLGLPESLAAASSTPKANRSDEQTKLLTEYVRATDAGIRKARETLAAAKKPVPPDAKLVQLQERQKKLAKPTPDAPYIVRLRSDAAASTKQVQNIRLTAAEDLTWALINSPAFLFNH